MYLFGDSLVFTLIAFGAGLWVALKIFTGQDSIVAVIIGAFLLAMFGTSLNLFLSQNITIALAIIALLVLVGQYLTGLSITEAAVVFVIAWLVGTTLISMV